MIDQGRKLTGVTVIGRNEGERLYRCLESVFEQANIVAYVDSGSTDKSIEYAKKLGAIVISLDLSKPFSAGRARNAGAEALVAAHSDLKFIQFIDGDCVLSRNWLIHARSVFQQRPDTSIVCGRRREINPEHSVYNMMCDLEWNTPVGYADACGGDFLIKADTFPRACGI